MAAARIAGLIVLILTAGALPAQSRLVAAPSEAADHKAGGVFPDSSGPGPADEEDKSSEIIVAAPPSDVWDGGAARALIAGASVSPVAAAIRRSDDVQFAPAEPETRAPAAATTADSRSQRVWLTSRHAHAPPECA